MADLIAGVCYVKVDGEQLLLKGSLSCTVSDETREARHSKRQSGRLQNHTGSTDHYREFCG